MQRGRNFLLKENMSLNDKDHYKEKQKAVEFLYKEKYEVVCRVAHGRFSTVLAVKTPMGNLLVAAKIVVTEDTWPGELNHWKSFCHENIVQLMDVITLPTSNVFIMTLCMTSLRNIFEQNEFRSAGSSLTWTKTWILDVTRGLSFLHSQEICHLNLQPSNIFINMKRRAEIGDFGCVTTTTSCDKNFGLPKEYSPPEFWSEMSEPNRSSIKGIPYDLWSLGMMAFNVWTDHALEKKICHLDDWKSDFYPHMFEALKVENFKEKISLAFPKADINNKDIRDALNFIEGLLCCEPSERPDTSMVLQHASLSDGNARFTSDFIWMFHQDEHYERANKTCTTAV